MSLNGQNIKGLYQVYEKVGQGAAATVYLARDLSRNRLVAVKAIHPHLSKEGQFLDRFRREAELLRQLTSPYVVQIYDYGMEGDISYIVMEYVQGKTLSQILEDTDYLEVRQALDIARQVAQCLADISAQNIVHRDIKPGNIMVTPDGQVKIMDFGIAKSLVMTGLTQTGVLGTPYYLSPEQGEGSQTLDVRSDIYSLGVVLFQLLTGGLPYEDTQPVALIMKHLNEPIPSLRERREDIPQAVEDLVKKCLGKRPAQRFQTPQELIRAIDQIQSPGLRPAGPATMPEDALPSQQLRTEFDELHRRVARLEAQPTPPALPIQPIAGPKRASLQRAGLLFLIAFVLLFGFLGIMLPASSSDPSTVVVTPPNLEGPIAAEVDRQLNDRLKELPTGTPVDLSAPVATEVANQLPALSASVAAEAVRQVEAMMTAQPTATVTIPNGSISIEKLDFATGELVHDSLWQGENVCFNLIEVLQLLGYSRCLYVSSPGAEWPIWHSSTDCSDTPAAEPTGIQKQTIWSLKLNPERLVYVKARWMYQIPYLICTRNP